MDKQRTTQRGPEETKQKDGKDKKKNKETRKLNN